MTRLLRARLAAGIGAVCVAAHTLVALTGLAAGNLGLFGVALGMAVLCTPCVAHLWRGPTAATWTLTAIMAAAMLALHGSLTALAGHQVYAHGQPGLNFLAMALLLLSGTVAALDRFVERAEAVGEPRILFESVRIGPLTTKNRVSYPEYPSAPTGSTAGGLRESR